MQKITQKKLEDRFGPEIGSALYEQLSEKLGDLSSVALIDGFLDLSGGQIGGRKGA